MRYSALHAVLRRWRGLLLCCVFLFPCLLSAEPLSQEDFAKYCAQLKDANPQVRRQAAMQLGYSNDPQAAKPLIAARYDKDPGVRGSIAYALGSCRNVTALDTLRAMLFDDSPGVRAAAAEALGSISQPEYWLPPRADGNRLDPEAARKAVGWNETIEALTTVLKDNTPFVRVSAAAALDALGDARGTTFLLNGMRSTDPLTRRRVFQEFERTMHRRSTKVVDIALELLPKEQDPGARIALVGLIGASRDRRAFEPLVAAMKTDARLCSTVLQRLGQVPDPRVFDTVIAYRQHADRHVRYSVAFALGQLDDPRAAGHLLVMLDDGEVSVQQAAMQSLSRFARDPRVAQVLIQALADDRYANSRWSIIQGPSASRSSPRPSGRPRWAPLRLPRAG